MRIRISVWGGLAGQLCGLATGLWVQEALRRPVGIDFHNGGVSRRHWQIDDLTEDFDVRGIHEPAEIVLGENGEYHSENLYPWKTRVRSAMSRLGTPLRLSIRGPLINKALVGHAKPWTLTLWGYPIDWNIITEALPMVSARIAESRRPNFFEGAGSDDFIAIHWRLGDYVLSKRANQVHGSISVSALSEALDSLPQRDLPIRLFTDSPELARVRLADAKLRDRVSVVSQDIWQDLYDMSRARYFIGSHSGISLWTLAAIQRSGQGLCLLPDRWFRASDGLDFATPEFSGVARYLAEFD